MEKPNTECSREDCKISIINITLSNPIQDPSFIIKCSTCNKKWKGTVENGEKTYEEIK